MLFTLGERLSLGRTIAKLKGMTTESVRNAGGVWQANFFEHRLRPDEQTDPFARYVFMNPYRAGLLDRRAVWSGWLTNADSLPAFTSMLDQGKHPPPEWMNETVEEMGLDATALGEV